MERPLTLGDKGRVCACFGCATMVANAAKLMAEFQDFMLPAFFAPPLTKAQTPVSFVNAIVEAYKRRNIDPSSALEKSQIEPKILNNASARITALQMEAVSGLAMRELDDEALGWFNRRLPWGSYGMLVRASLSAPTLGVAMQRWCRHHGLLTDTITITLTENEGLAYLKIEERSDLGALREFCIVSVLRNALGVACWLSDSRISLRQTRLRFLAPAHQASYQVLFEGETLFGAETHCVTFDARYLDLPIRRDEAALQTMLQRALLLTVRPYRRDRLLVEKVRHALAHHPEHSRNAEDLAIHLNLSARTLHRQLKDEGASLQQLKDAVRRDVAVAQLQRSKRPIKQIAALAGFQNEKSFIRAFKIWTGQTPDAFRGRDGSS